jgi:hypothetical protein
VDVPERHLEGRAMDLTVCPECAAPAEIQWRAVLASTDGPVEHAKILCVRRHWFLLPIAAIARPPLWTATAMVSRRGRTAG